MFYFTKCKNVQDCFSNMFIKVLRSESGDIYVIALGKKMEKKNFFVLCLFSHFMVIIQTKNSDFICQV